MKKLAIIGASYLQAPLIIRANQLGFETHVFAWAANDVGETLAYHFYPISIIEKEEILQVCRKIQIDGICSIGSDLAVITVNYVAKEMNLIGNSLISTENSTNKSLMRRCFEENGDPSPRSICVDSADDERLEELSFPLIVKPVDRSGSRGIAKVLHDSELSAAIERAKSIGFLKKAVVEEFVEGHEYSVECISWEGKHELLAITQKYTTGSPGFVETAHMEPALITEDLRDRITGVVFHALESLEIQYGASHSELKVTPSGEIVLIEIGARMGGDVIGSDLVQLSTGIDFVKAVIQVAVGQKPDIERKEFRAAAVRFILSSDDLSALERVKKENPSLIVRESVGQIVEKTVTDSSERFGYFILSSSDPGQLLPYLPERD